MKFQDKYPTLADYMLTVDYLIHNAMYGMTSADLEDYDYASDYDNKISPIVAARASIRATLNGQ